ncbi:tryptophan 7-halogenase [Pseudoalteromonas tunicata]|uniref:tryptophan halogenase family protein n=1 Tax=Pseudoalteromonas tunicata TaxID=314281 RepID=UPI00273F876C|nr:tryptophan halogenase family protein [Pseudoalteromonas tunicata]MDP5211539.1 tryptophan 7-halogenase [Pseudoalteromonas tunicata]
MDQNIQKIVILGGGTAGWLAAATLGNIFKHSTVEIELIESEEVGIIGVGEATIPPLLATLESLGIDQVDFIKHTQASFKWGIEFVDWCEKGKRYFHPFGQLGQRIDGHDFYQCWLKTVADGNQVPLMAYSPEAQLAEQQRFFLPFEAMNTPLAGAQYALHLDAVLVGEYLSRFAQKIGVKRTLGHVEAVECDERQFIRTLQLQDGRSVSGDFFIDCSGFKGLLIEQTLQTGYDDWSAYLPCNRAVTVQTKNVTEPTPCTTATAQTAGWSWRIPLQHRTGNGYVFCDKYITDQQAIQTLLNSVVGEVIGEPRIIPFVTGIRKQSWHNNCLALGLAQGFLEPLESTAIHLVSKTLALFVRMFPDKQCNSIQMAEFNRRVRADYQEIRDFLVLHYCTTKRSDSAFWQDCQTMAIPESLQQKIDFYKVAGGLIPEVEALFQPTSWYAVFEGMQVRPAGFNPTLHALNSQKLAQSLAQGQAALARSVVKQPSHQAFLTDYCQAPKIES